MVCAKRAYWLRQGLSRWKIRRSDYIAIMRTRVIWRAGLARVKGISLDAKKVVTNIVIFDVKETGTTAEAICSALAKRRILCGPTGKFSIRMVTHYDVDRAGIDRAITAMGETCSAS